MSAAGEDEEGDRSGDEAADVDLEGPPSDSRIDTTAEPPPVDDPRRFGPQGRRPKKARPRPAPRDDDDLE